MDNQHYHAVYEQHSKEGTTSHDAVLIEINKSEQPKDFDGTKLNLETHMYGMNNLSPIKMMLKKGSAACKIIPKTYDVLRGFRHPNLLPIENYSTRGHGWFVVPCIDGSLGGWMRSRNDLSMFQEGGHIAPQFRAMLIDLCSLLDKLSGKKNFPREFGIGNCYIKIVSGVPKILVLLTDVRANYYSSQAMSEKMVGLITDCCQILHINLSDISKEFVSYFCDSTKALHLQDSLQVSSHVFLENYPDNWTFNDKECYLFNIVSGNHLPWHVIRSRINNSTLIDWPVDDNGDIVQALQNVNDLGSRWEADTDYRFGYIHLCRNCLKHFNELPIANQQELGGSPQGLIERMEKWDPRIWIKLYHIYGPLVHK